MNNKKIIAILYFAYTIYIVLVVDATSLRFFYILPSIILLWTTYFIFFAGYSIFSKGVTSKESNSENQEVWLYNGNKIKLLIISLSSIVCSVLVGHYYTGQTPATVIYNLKNGISLYGEYQKFFNVAQRGTMTFAKIPYIFMMFYIKAILFYSYCAFIVKKSKLNRVEMIYLGIITMSLAFFGIVRGTNFEFFEIGMMVIFVLFSKKTFTKNKEFIIILIKVIVLIIVLTIIYSFMLRLRGYTAFYSISGDVFYSMNGFVTNVAPLISYIVIMLYGYFGHGFNYISVYINEIWFSSINYFLAGLLPMGHESILGFKLHEVMITQLDMGVMWQPDNALIISNFGFIGLVIIVFLMGIISKLSYKRNTALSYLMQFMIVMQMLSLPVGHFIFTSSSNIMIFFLLLIYWFWKVFIKLKIKINLKK